MPDARLRLLDAKKFHRLVITDGRGLRLQVALKGNLERRPVVAVDSNPLVLGNLSTERSERFIGSGHTFSLFMRKDKRLWQLP
jgi:hypothetical protein